MLEQFGAPLLQTPLLVEVSEQVRSHLSPTLLLNLAEQLQTPQLEQLSFRLQQGTFWSQLAELIDQQQNQEQFGELLFDQIMAQFWEQQQAEWRRHVQRQPAGQLLIQLGDTLGEWTAPFTRSLEAAFWHPLRNQPIFQEWERSSRQLLGMFSMPGLGFNALWQTVEVSHPALLDFCISVLKVPHDRQQWQVLRSLVTECSLYLTFEKFCLVLDRPIRLALDPEGRLHAEGEPAVQFADGYRLYFFRDVQIPETYGSLHPHHWQSRWLLEEPNAELRRVLIQGIGYTRLCQELRAVELDSWREYTLLRIDQSVDVEPIFLLKMTCPSTGYTHATRVPPEVQTAREAIRWVNWDVDPEEFITET
ncbi:DUF6745 domain-containing protein [Leptothermofonsia sp. ETS-13]|uniref:DUF6745 domain-containing protein n=1 Tax=Leptothermofonsia sp. ETS-13 TaxID=3035696 RepID=UPI003BA06B0F